MRWKRRRRRRGYSLASAQDIYVHYTLPYPSSHPPPLIILLTQSNSPSHHSKRTQSLQTTQERKKKAQPSIHFQICELCICSTYRSIRFLGRRKNQSRPVCIQDMKSQGYRMYDQKTEKKEKRGKERGAGILKRWRTREVKYCYLSGWVSRYFYAIAYSLHRSS